MNFKLKVWRQKDRQSKGKLVDYEAPDISPHASFLEMLDIVNERLLLRGEEPIAFDSDCREGICGTCSLTINGEAHGPDHPGAACELYMRKFQRRRDHHRRAVPRKDPFRSSKIWWSIAARSIESCRPADFISARAGSAPEANSIPVPKHDADRFHGSGGLHRLRRVRGGVSERIGHAFHGGESFAPGAFAAGRAGTRQAALLKMVSAMDAEGFGNCTNTYECEAVCPAEISASFIAKLNREYSRATLKRSAGE